MVGLIPRALVFIGALTLVADVGFAQDKPDFSGSWVLASAPSDTDLSQTLSIQQLVVRTNVRGEPTTPFFRDITIARTLSTGRESKTYQIGIVSGSAPGNASAAKTRLDVEWEGQTLVIASASYTGPAPETGNWSERRETFSLMPNGDLRLETESRSSNADQRAIVAIYRRP